MAGARENSSELDRAELQGPLPIGPLPAGKALSCVAIFDPPSLISNWTCKSGMDN